MYAGLEPIAERSRILTGEALILASIVGVTGGIKPVPAGDRADRLERIEATLLDVLERVKRIEGFVGRPTPAPALEAAPVEPAWAVEHRARIMRLDEPERSKRLGQLREMIRPKFDPTAPLPVNPKTGRSALVEAMEQQVRDFDEAEAREAGRIK